MNYKEIFGGAYRGKKVFLTGHTGFKGTWMMAWLHLLGAEVKGFALEPENANDLYNQIHGNKLCNSVIADIRNANLLKREIISFQPDFIFHLAAQSLVRRSYEKPLYTFEVNVNGTANLLEAVRQLQKPCSIIIITTDKVYENIEKSYAYNEEDKLGGYDPYSASKAAAEIVLSSYRNSFFNPSKFPAHQKAIASARAGNVIGGGDRARDRIIPDIVKGIEKNEMIQIRNPEAIRPWQHVLEPLSGYLLLGKKMNEDPLSFSSTWNFGPLVSDVVKVKDVVEKALEVMGKGKYILPQQKDDLHEAGFLQLDIGKAIEKLSWHPRLNSSQAIEWTMKWYKTATTANAFDYTVNQIEQYQQL